MPRLATCVFRIAVLIAPAAMAAPAMAQDVAWSQAVSVPGNRIAYLGDGRFVTKALAIDRDGNAIVTGSTADGSNTDFLTTKLAAATGAIAWQKVYSGGANLNDDALAAAVDASGNVFVLGNSTDSAGATDVKIVKYAAADGAILWQSTWDGGVRDFGYSLALDAAGNAIVGAERVNATGNTDIAILKFGGSNGALAWQRIFDSGDEDFISEVVVDGAGGILVAGNVGRSATNMDILALKVTPDGAIAWQKTFDAGAWDEAYGIAADASGNAVVTGFATVGGISTAKALKYGAADGALLWQQSIVTGRNNRGQAVGMDAAGNAIVIAQALNEAGNYDYRTIKYSAASGAILWEKTFDGGADDYVYQLAIDAAGNVIVTGATFANDTNSDWKTIAYASTDGAVLWQHSAGGSQNGIDTAYGAVAVGGAVYVAGTTLEAGLPATVRVAKIRHAASIASALVSPASGATLGTSATFTWDAGSGVSERFLAVGTSAGASDIYGAYQGAALSRTVTGIPANGKPVYVRLLSWVNGGWQVREATYVATAGTAPAPATPAKSEITNPAPGSTLASSSATFSWTAGSGVTERFLAIGTSAGGSDVYGAYQGSATSRTVSGLPASGTVYVRLLSWIAGGWQTSDATYMAASGAAAPAPVTKSIITSPASGSALGGSSATFAWSAGSGVAERFLAIGTTPGATDIYGAYQGGASSRTVSGLPTNGATVHVRLLSWIAGGWQASDASYAAAGP